MIRTDGKPTIAWAPLPQLPAADGEPEQIPGQITVEDALEEWEREQREAEPLYGGYN